MQYLAIISGVASILGFILTVANIFPAHAKIRNYFTIFVIGVFCGSLLGSIKTININFPENPTSSGTLLFFILSLVGLFFLIIAGVFSEDTAKRTQCLTMAGNGFAGLIVCGMLILFFLGVGRGLSIPNVYDVTQEEILVLAETNINKGNIDRAIQLLERYAYSLGSNDSRKETVLRKIESLKRQQFNDTK